MTDPRFDQSIDRNQFPTMKSNPDRLNEHFGVDNAVPLWVADMDFPAPQVVIDSLVKRAQHGIYGYEYRTDGFHEAILNWYKTRHNWDINPNHLEQAPTILNAVTVLMNQHSEEGDGVIIQPPVFFEFNMVLKASNRKRMKNSLKLVDGRYEIDFDDLEAKASDPNNKVMILCNPHNPVGRVWTREELVRVATICAENDVFLISDEVHGDIVYAPNTYTSVANLGDELAQHVAVCLSPAKTFNIAGMVDAMVVIPNKENRERFHDFAHRYQTNKINLFTSAAVEVAYRDAGDWVDNLLIYLQGNIDFIRETLAEKMPQVKLIEPEGTYLVWLDLRGLDMDAKALQTFLAQEAKIAVNAGYWFGGEGAGFARMNIASPRAMIDDALTRLENALNNK